MAAARSRLPELKQPQIAAHFGVTVQAVSNWETDKDFPGFGRIPELRRILRVTYSWLLEGDGPPPDPLDPLVLLEDKLSEEYAAAAAKSAKGRAQAI